MLSGHFFRKTREFHQSSYQEEAQRIALGCFHLDCGASLSVQVHEDVTRGYPRSSRVNGYFYAICDPGGHTIIARFLLSTRQRPDKIADWSTGKSCGCRSGYKSNITKRL